jgi:2-polyprenyl-6-methoxyphenol hydroxylase-like FAD-dependent oxidoreductase
LKTTEPASTTTTSCCIAGGGPGGVMLALLLARAGIPVTLLESHADFDRDFRGDSVHTYTLELLDELGMCEELLQIPHTRMGRIQFANAAGTITVADFRRLKTKYPYQVVMPQVDLLNFLADKVRQHPHARILMRSSVQDLIIEQDVVRGVVYRDVEGRLHEIRATLVVGADGRHSTVRQLAGIELVQFTAPMDILWFRLPRRDHDSPDHPGVHVTFGPGYFCIVTNRPGREWQIGYAIVKSSFAQLRAQGIETLRQNVAALLPAFADRVDALKDFHQVAVLATSSSYCRRWWRRGLLLIGDAAHVMSPVAGVGILHAVQDAVAAANALIEPLRNGKVTDADLAAVQKGRWRPVRRTQSTQAFIHEHVIKPALTASNKVRFPLWLRLVLQFNNKLPRSSAWIASGYAPPRLKNDAGRQFAQPIGSLREI